MKYTLPSNRKDRPKAVSMSQAFGCVQLSCKPSCSRRLDNKPDAVPCRRTVLRPVQRPRCRERQQRRRHGSGGIRHRGHGEIPDRSRLLP
jgi:hypothetical protein